MNYRQNILLSNYWHAVYEIVFIKFWRIAVNFMWRFFCLQAEANASATAIDWIIPRAWNNGYSVLAYLNCDTYIVFLVVFALVGGLSLVASYSVCLSLAISCAGYYYYYHCLYDNQRWLGTTIDEGGGLPLGQVFWRGQVTISGIIRTCICCSSGLRVLYLPFCMQVWLSLLLSPVNA